MLVRGCKSAVILAPLLLAVVRPAAARTVVITDSVTDKVAAISAEAPRMSWACVESTPGYFNNLSIQIVPNRAVLIRLPIEAVPAGQKITRAELIVPVTYAYAAESRLFVWRVLKEWGAGVCHLYRTTRPQPTPWSVAGGKGNSTDRAGKPTAIEVFPIGGATERAINVTQDVELWYTGSAPNCGWMLSVEDTSTTIAVTIPAHSYRDSWKLRITYEPQ